MSLLKAEPAIDDGSAVSGLGEDFILNGEIEFRRSAVSGFGPETVLHGEIDKDPGVNTVPLRSKIVGGKVMGSVVFQE